MRLRRELKKGAKELLAGNWGIAIKLNIVPVIFQVLTGLAISGLLVGISYYFSHYAGVSDDFFSYGNSSVSVSNGRSFIGELITAYLLVSVDFALIDWVRTKAATSAPFKKAFPAFTGQYIIPVFVLFVVQWVLVFLWSLLLIIPGIIKSFSYAQTYYIFKDTQAQVKADQVDYVDYVTLSRRLMDGHKWEFFLLKLSFLGWDLLGWLTCGIAFIWITPYKHMTYMNYYVNLAEGHDFIAELKD